MAQKAHLCTMMHLGRYLSGRSTGTPDSEPPWHAGLYTAEHSVPPAHWDNPDLRSGCDNCCLMGSHIREPRGQGVHGGQGIVAQPPCRWRNGDETQGCHGQHHHVNWTVDVPHVPHLHTLPNWGAFGGCSMENVPTIYVSERWVTGGGLKNKVLWVTPGPTQVLAPQ